MRVERVLRHAGPFSVPPPRRPNHNISFRLAAATAITHTQQQQQVWPKVFDIVNLVVYLAVFIATTFCPRPMALLTPVAVAGANAVYFGGSLVGRPFSDELARESAPEGVRCCFFCAFCFCFFVCAPVRPCRPVSP